MYACQAGKADIVTILLQCDADPNIEDRDVSSLSDVVCSAVDIE